MNKLLYRLIFNKARGMLMVVAEIAGCGRGRSARQRTGAAAIRREIRLHPLSFALWLAAGCVSLPAQANIVADGNAPRKQQPTVISTANGLPQVNIQKPSAAGVSRNTYSRFDVDRRGAVLNNSHKNTRTQLGGMVTANPWLGKQEARVILNEVNSRNPSQLNGFIEVAGKRADVVIANPAGITCNGCGFINASRNTLTTGTPVMQNGQLKSFDVNGGRINIEGKGLNDTQGNYTQLIAQSVAVNAQIHAQQLNVVAGRNQVSAAGAVTQVKAQAENKPAFAVDVSALGGMYANKITLVGTEKGVGVRNAGELGASAGELRLTADGRLENRGTLQSRDALRIASQGGIDNTGSMRADKKIDLATQGALNNSGSVVAHDDLTARAGRINSTKTSTLAAGIDDKGAATRPGSLTLNSNGELAAQGQNLATQRLTAHGTRVDMSASQTLADQIALTATAGDVSTADATVKSRQLDVNATERITNDRGQVSAHKLRLNAPVLSNRGGLLRQEGSDALTLKAMSLDNGGGAIITAGDLNVQAPELNNRQGLLESTGHALTLTADRLDNQQGTVQLSGAGQMAVTAQQLDGAQGELLSAGKLNVQGQAMNLDGATTQAQQVALKAQSLSHRGGIMQQQGGEAMTLDVAAGLNNHQGRLESNGDLQLHAGALDNSAGTLLAAGAASQRLNVAGALDNSDGNILAARAVALEAQTLQNQRGHLAATGGDMTLQIADELGNQGGRIEAQDALTSQSGAFNNDGGTLLGDAVTLDTRQQALSNAGGKLVADGALDLNSGRFDNTGGLAQAGDALRADTHGQALVNAATAQGGLLSGADMRILAGEMDNRAGVIAAQGQADIQGGTLANNGGRVVADGDVTLATQALDNTGGTLQSAHRLAVDTHQQTLNNGDRGALIATDALTLNSGDVNNQNGEIATGGDATLNTGAIDNRQGRMTAGGAAVLRGGDLNNQHGQIEVNGPAQLNTGSLDNSAGTLTSGDTLTLASRRLDNSGGRLQANKDMTLDTAGDAVINRDSGAQGGIIALGNLQLRGGDIDNQSGFIAASGVAGLTSGTVNNAQGQMAGNGGLLLHSQGVDNHSGTVQSGGDLLIDTAGQTLSNQDGRVVGTGATRIDSGSLDNQRGHIQGGSDLVLNAGAGALLNQDGKLLSAAGITLNADSLNNRAGQVQASGDGRIVLARQLDNRGGLVRGGQNLDLSAAEILNRDTSKGEHGIEASALNLTAQRLDNGNGALRATRQLIASINGMLDNRGGLTSSAGAFDLHDASQGQQLAINNKGGTLIAGSTGSLRAASLSGDGKVLSQGSLTLTLGSGFRNTAALGANGDLTLTTAGDLRNDGSMTSGGEMHLQALNINNTAQGEISGQAVHLNARDTLDNTGLIDGVLTHLVAGTLNNTGTGRIYGDHVAIETGRLNNLSQKGKAAVIAARDRLDIGASAIDNRDHALIYSAGDMHIGGTLDSTLHATGRGGELNNDGATIEAGRDAQIDVAQIDNSNRKLVTKVVTTENAQHHEAALSGQPTHYDWSDVDTSHKNKYGVHTAKMPDGSSGSKFYEYTFTRTVKETQVKQSDPGKILAGGNMQFNADRLTNHDSQIVAGGALGMNTGVLNNLATKGTRVITDVGRQTRWYSKKKKKKLGGTKTSQGKSRSNYRPAPVTQTIDLQTLVWQANGSAQGSGYQTQGHQDKRVADTARGAGNAGGLTSAAPVTLSALKATPLSSRPLALPPGQQFALTLPPGTVNGQAVTPVIRVVTPDMTLPDNSLFRVKPESQSHYLVETDPRFTNQKQWLGSDYMQAALADNQNLVQKRLGDGYYEQNLVRDQVTQLTGNRYLGNYSSDEDQFKGLMNNGIAFGKQYQLQPGVALSPEQMALLTSDIVWLVNQQVTLPDGTQQTVQVPQVYARVKQGDLTGDGALIGGHDVAIASRGDVINSGAIQGRAVTQVTAENLSNSGFISGNRVDLNARQNIDNIGGQIRGGDRVALLAGHDITSASTTGGDDSERWIDRPAGIYVQNNQGELRLSALNNVALIASDITNAGKAGKTAIAAGNDLQLSTLTTRHQERGDWGKGNNRAVDQQTDVGTSITTPGDLQLTAGRDINAVAATIKTDGVAQLKADRDITLTAGRASTDITEHSKQSSSGWLSAASQETHEEVHTRKAEGTTLNAGEVQISAGRDVAVSGSNVVGAGDVSVTAKRDVSLSTATETDYHYKEETKNKSASLSKTTLHNISEQSATREVGALLSGDNVTVKSGNDLRVKGSSVVGDGDVALSADHNVDITAATNTDSNWQLNEKKKSGLMGSGGIGFTIGSSKTKQDLKEEGTSQSQSQSTVGSNGRDVTISAGHQLHVGGSDLIAKKDLSLSGDSVVIDPGHDKRTSDQKFEQKSSGLTIALTGAVVDAVSNAVTAAKDASKQGDSRLAALQATKSVLSGYQAMQGKEMADTTGEPNSGIRISASINTQKSKSEQHQTSDQVSGSTLNAGGDLSINATGKHHGANSGDIVVAGSSMKAGGDASLNAARDILLTGAANTQKTTGSNSSSGGGVGVSFGVGQGSAGLSVFANVNAARGHEKGDGTDWTETTLDSGGKVSLHSGQDTSLTGAQVSGVQVTADIGRNLTVTSLQDSNHYDSKQSSVSAGGSFTFGTMTGSGYVNFSQDKMHSTFNSVAEQSGIFAGKGGFDVTVGSHTQLNGGAIGSTATADKNRLDTGTLGYSHISNEADYKVSHTGGGFSSSGSFGAQGALNAASTLMSAVGSSGHAQGTTQAAVSEGTIIVRDKANQRQDIDGLQRDVTQANDAISPIFNKEKEQTRLQTVQMVSDIGNQVADIVRTQSDLDGLKAAIAQTGTSLQGLPEKERLAKLVALRDTAVYKKVTENTGTGSDVQRAITAATAAVSGLAGGNLNAALAGAAAPYIANEIGKNITAENTAAGVMAHAVVNAVLAKVQGQNALAGASGAAVGEAMGYLIAKEVYKKDPSQLNETEKQTVAALSTLASGLAGALAGNSTEAVATAAKAGQTTVENNFLGESSRKRKDELVQKGLTKGLTLDEEKELIRLDTDNQLSDEYLDKYRHDPGSLTPVERDFLNLALNAFYYENLKYYDTDTVNKLMGSLFAEGATFRDYDFPYAASSELKNKITDINKAGLGFWDALTYTRDISPQERLYKDAVSDLGVVNEHAYWAQIGEPVLNFLPGAPGLVVNIKDAITGGSQMGQATASFLNDGPNADSAGRFLEGFLNAAGAVAGTHWGYKDGVTPSGSYSPPWQNSTIVPEKEMATVSASAIGLKWGEGNMKQGMPWEDYVGTTLPADARLPKNFRTFDYYDYVTKTAVSVKSLDTQTASKLNNPKAVYYSIKGNIDTAANFKRAQLSERVLNSSMISNKEIQLAVPASTTKAQWVEINRAVEYGKNRGVKVTVTQVK
ncbi:hemagglutinin repeat-containing protein [Cronobacter dublinensis]